ncbi:hypothetical protein Vadar_010448 [Vaccinium darrowii]|uniref:Uncharacterized protein n=1 Tax=Vaccinium darrowii TaxID=229202 RepID=A0ACB7YUC8_9ERIC|nr:hypothetical protein Vadar_010448 [Vaccinium darrowii]
MEAVLSTTGVRHYRREKDKMMNLEVRGAINVVEACAQTYSIEKIVYISSLTAAIWRENICSEKDVDEKSWSNQDFCLRRTVATHMVAVSTNLALAKQFGIDLNNSRKKIGLDMMNALDHFDNSDDEDESADSEDEDEDTPTPLEAR